MPEGQLLVAARSPDYAAQARNVEVGPAGPPGDLGLGAGGERVVALYSGQPVSRMKTVGQPAASASPCSE